jgi:hypothetical protein
MAWGMETLPSWAACLQVPVCLSVQVPGRGVGLVSRGQVYLRSLSWAACVQVPGRRVGLVPRVMAPPRPQLLPVCSALQHLGHRHRLPLRARLGDANRCHGPSACAGIGWNAVGWGMRPVLPPGRGLVRGGQSSLKSCQHTVAAPQQLLKPGEGWWGLPSGAGCASRQENVGR